MQILLANPRGFCAGVKRAINIVEQVLKIYGAPIYVRHEVVHNSYVIKNLRERGVIFIEEINEVPDAAILIFSAHGVSQTVRAEAKARNFTRIFDATCPLVTKVHMEVARASRKGIEAILIGHSGHPEVEGTIGQYNNPKGGIYLVESIEDVSNLTVKNEKKLYFMTQTTLSVDDTSIIINFLQKRFSKIIGPRKNDICYATMNRQKAANVLALNTEIVLVIGSKNSSNANRLIEVAKKTCKIVKLIDSVDDIKEGWFKDIKYIGITAGASSPDILIYQVIQRLLSLGCKDVTELFGFEEKIIFELPKQLYNSNYRTVIES
ncbi:4-hydroxy-3-methylbut-2-enyl diphosphate reductase [Pantoea sp. Aalb]|uniref:4-hydroxy-3-methylbut-2-enyl diphosphate reductase n=1 Tax=Pantoea sp. Aalb TaxID=2576762 RepID=UPI00132A7AFF|nr:4-hydroxy-3-methylbut-2-enyl diphosphate reductase [Pantoea sp. Aalb]MXP67162.1 4-hydroxy-3-methylbut-2-enyl diphosphate reductase [Pantoea sp. Aalb]